MQLRRIALTTAAIFSVPAMAAAQLTPAPPLEGLYIGAGAGVNWLQDEHFINSTGTAAAGSIHSSPGFVALGSLGYALSNGLRFEIEGDFRRNGFSGASDFGFPGGASGTERKTGVMFNVLYDFSHLVQVPWFSPYAGLGVGYAWSHLNNFALFNTAGAAPRFGSSDTQGAIAYQAIFGGATQLPVPGLALTVEYRFYGVGSRNYNISATPAAGVAPVSGRARLGNDFNHAILLGLRYNFNQPPPAPPPTPIAAPAPAAARSYLVFFDWDKATLSDRARQIIKEAADNSTRVQYTRIEVNGYTDTSGTKPYNQDLSVRRARAVQGELIRDGVPANAITIQGFGDTNLLVPTGAGVREPQNRRVEIVLR
ncbi:MAG: OmpA family protein [Acetobacteraceae bacterium]